jgi:hypothetical protein
MQTSNSTPEDQMTSEQLAEQANENTRDLSAAARAKARAAYEVVDGADFAFCVEHHLSEHDKATMRAADLYFCHRCGRLLKSRKQLRESLVRGHELHRLEMLFEMATGRVPGQSDWEHGHTGRALRRMSQTLCHRRGA